MTFPDMVGVVGVLLILAAYALAQIGRLKIDSVAALLMNLAGAILVMVSLRYRFNLPSFLIEVAWALVALFGLLRRALRRRD